MRNFAPVIKNLFKIFIIGLLPLHMAAVPSTEISETSEFSESSEQLAVDTTSKRIKHECPTATVVLGQVTVTAVKQGHDLRNQAISVTSLSRPTAMSR